MVLDPSQNILFPSIKPLAPIFTPKSIAIIGATDKENSVGRTLIQNLIKGKFKGKLYPVNPKRSELFELPCYASVSKIERDVDLAVIVTPAKTVPAIIKECVEKGVKGAIIISAGFKELGPEGAKLEKEVLETAAAKNLRIIGPNCLGVMNPHFHLNATFAAGMALSGNTAFISQSGALCTAVLDWSFQEEIGFSAFVSIGSMADVHWGDLIDYLGEDENTKNILIYMETIGDPRAFLSAAKRISFKKPIIVIKAGRTEEAAKAAASHTGSLAGSDAIFDTAMHRVGILRVSEIGELFKIAATLSKQGKPKGPYLTIMTNAGGPAVLATDSLIENGGKLTSLHEQTIEKLNAILPAAWSHGNPVDILGDASAELYQKALHILMEDPASSGLLIILTPQDMTEPTETAKKIVEIALKSPLPLLASWMGGVDVEKGRSLLSKSPISEFEFPDDAAKIFALAWKNEQDLSVLYETPKLLRNPREESPLPQDSLKDARDFLDKLKEENRTILTENESKTLLEIYGIPVVKTYITESREEALSIAEKLGYPLVLKLNSKTITHKSDVDGVKLNLKTKEDVGHAFDMIKKNVTEMRGSEHFQGVAIQRMVQAEGYELILGSAVDPQFGPVVLFGLGGVLVEIFKDRAIELPPLNATLAKRFMQKTKIYEAFKGVRGRPPINTESLEGILIRFSELIAQQPRIKELDINPLLASPGEVIALDARVILHDWSIKKNDLPRLAIRPFPLSHVKKITLKNGEVMTLRPIRAEDEPLLIEFHENLSEKTVRERYLKDLSLQERTAHERLSQICWVDYDRDITLVAENPEGQIHAVARLNRLSDPKSTEFKILVTDSYQGKGLGKLFLEHLLHVGKMEKVETVFGTLLKSSASLIHICESLGFVKTEENTCLIFKKML